MPARTRAAAPRRTRNATRAAGLAGRAPNTRRRPDATRRRGPARGGADGDTRGVPPCAASSSSGTFDSWDSIDDEGSEREPEPQWLRALSGSSNILVQALRGVLVSLESVASTVADVVLDLLGPDTGTTRPQVKAGIRVAAIVVVLVFVKSILSTAIVFGAFLLAVSALSFVVDRETGADGGDNKQRRPVASGEPPRRGRRQRAAEAAQQQRRGSIRHPPPPPRDAQGQSPRQGRPAYGDGAGDGDLVDVYYQRP